MISTVEVVPLEGTMYKKSKPKRMKAYLAHSWRSRHHPDKYRIISILNERGVDVIDPFEGEDKLCREFGEENYYPNCKFDLGRSMWRKDLQQIDSCDMLVAWVPNHIDGRFIGTSFELGYAYIKRKFIQIISPLRHPAFAFLKKKKAQVFESVDDFEKLKEMWWE